MKLRISPLDPTTVLPRDPVAATELVEEKHGNDVLALLRSKLRADDALEAWQDTFEGFYRAVARYADEGRDAYRGLVFAIAYRIIGKYRRRAWVEHRLREALLSSWADPVRHYSTESPALILRDEKTNRTEEIQRLGSLIGRDSDLFTLRGEFVGLSEQCAEGLLAAMKKLSDRSRRLVEDSLSALDDDLRIARRDFTLEEELEWTDIAIIQSVAEPTLRKRYSRALQRIRTRET